MNRILGALSSIVLAATGASWLFAAGAAAQSTGARIDKLSNQRLSGTYYARHVGMTYDECVRECLRDTQCLALEHHRGGGLVFGRQSYCKLFSEPGSPRASNTTDIGFKRTSPSTLPPPAVADAKKKADELKKKAEADKRDTELRKLEAEREVVLRRQEEIERQTSQRRAEDGERQRREEALRQQQEIDRAAKAPTGGVRPPSAPGASPPPPPPVASAPPPSPPRPVSPATPPPVAAQPPPPAKSAPPPVAAAKKAPPPAAEPAPETARPRSITPAPGAGGAAPTEWDVVPVFYGTDRTQKSVTTKQGTRIGYGSDRANRVDLGRALVTVPKVHQVPKLERPWKVTVPFVDWTVYEEAEDPRKHFTVQEIKSLSKAELLALVRDRLGVSSTFRNQALVMVHGYNNDFDYALYRSAQITYDLNFDGASFLYSWPSGGGVAQYLYDLNSAAQAEPYLTQFLEMVLADSGAERVHLIAHSMGSSLLLQVLRRMKDRNPAVASRVSQIILAAPDVDIDTFTWLAGEIRGIGRGITLYASSNDVALQVSRRFAGDKPRAGDVPQGIGPAVVSGVDTIDISALSTEYFALGHASYAEKTPLLRDIDLLLKTGQRPPELRFPVYRKMPTPKGDYWLYPSSN
jgi:esterase/lipase superfamily enzyme